MVNLTGSLTSWSMASAWAKSSYIFFRKHSKGSRKLWCSEYLRKRTEWLDEKHEEFGR
ncbi:rCG61553 [Rattus norvegicus]|uniref:RCG61553 n=1 Tax=Rattus norvegicus TaxID=10116 RepID=A6HBR8_RAT|nr:rCG61553 [Rattus norvegicus]